MDTHLTGAPEPTAYGRKPATSNDLLTQVGPGTPCGEFMRRYWQPVAKSSDVTPRPQNLRILGEDLILFRDKKGRPGLVYPRCMHRGTSLYYGKVEEEGIRCCYHGWLFSVEGHCLDQPCEPEHGLHREAARQPWYPLEERYGLVWAYMGPPDKKPALPRYDIFEDLQPGERLEVDATSWAAYGESIDPIVPYSWLQHYDNIMDPYHVQVLHSTFSTVQFAEGFKVMPTVDYEYVDHGIIYKAHRNFPDGRKMDRVSTALLPNIEIVPSIFLEESRGGLMGWIVPTDDASHRMFHIARLAGDAPSILGQPAPLYNGKSWSQLDQAGHQDFPGDYEAQMGQGTISLHSEEHLAQSDRGVAMLRRLVEQQIKVVAEGGDPLGTEAGGNQAPYYVRSGNYYQG